MPQHNAPKLYLDEHLSPRLASQLRRYEFDVIACREAQMLSLTDAEQLEFACSEGRAIVTFNVRDFVALHAEYAAAHKPHWGIVLSTEEPLGVLLHRLLRLLNTVSAHELKDQLRWLNEFR